MWFLLTLLMYCICTSCMMQCGNCIVCVIDKQNELFSFAKRLLKFNCNELCNFFKINIVEKSQRIGVHVCRVLLSVCLQKAKVIGSMHFDETFIRFRTLFDKARFVGFSLLTCDKSPKIVPIILPWLVQQLVPLVLVDRIPSRNPTVT